MTSHKSPSGKRWATRQETHDILATRRARAQAKAEGTGAQTFDGVHGYESAGHYHWHMLHKNLAHPILRTRRVKVVE